MCYEIPGDNDESTCEVLLELLWPPGTPVPSDRQAYRLALRKREMFCGQKNVHANRIPSSKEESVIFSKSLDPGLTIGSRDPAFERGSPVVEGPPQVHVLDS